MEGAGEKKEYGYGNRPLWQWVVLYVIIGAVVYGLVYYFFLAKKGGYSYNQTQVAPVASSQAVTVNGTDFAFSPSAISTKVGRTVTVTLKNGVQFAHNFVISDLSVQSKTIRPGESDTVMFTPSKAGKFTYICTIPGHADKGMIGTLTVD